MSSYASATFLRREVLAGPESRYSPEFTRKRSLSRIRRSATSPSLLIVNAARILTIAIAPKVDSGNALPDDWATKCNGPASLLMGAAKLSVIATSVAPESAAFYPILCTRRLNGAKVTATNASPGLISSNAPSGAPPGPSRRTMLGRAFWSV